jgi:hypothetical protein
MATGETAQGEPGSCDEAEAVQGDVGVLGAGGEIEALRGSDGVGDGREDPLVDEEGETERETVGLAGWVGHAGVPGIRLACVGASSSRGMGHAGGWRVCVPLIAVRLR